MGILKCMVQPREEKDPGDEVGMGSLLWPVIVDTTSAAAPL